MSVVSDAQSLVGKVRYKFGADNVTGGVADCSSFTQYVYKKNGFNIGRNTEAQYSQGTAVKRQDLKAGDLVFFHSTYPSGYKDGVSHVGIYIGDGRFVHNSSSKGVTVNNLSDSYYAEHYLGARRVNGATDEKSVSTKTPFVGTVNPTYTAEEISTGSSKLDILGQVVKFICILLLIVLALVFFFNAFGVSASSVATSAVTKTMKKKEGESTNE